MTDYYLEVNDNNLKLIVSLSQYELPIKRGDVILLKFDISTTCVKFGGKIYTHPQFKLCERGNSIKSLSIANAISNGYLFDITQQINREEKLNQLGL
jgi:hypothetical protein